MHVTFPTVDLKVTLGNTADEVKSSIQRFDGKPTFKQEDAQFRFINCS